MNTFSLFIILYPVFMLSPFRRIRYIRCTKFCKLLMLDLAKPLFVFQDFTYCCQFTLLEKYLLSKGLITPGYSIFIEYFAEQYFSAYNSAMSGRLLANIFNFLLGGKFYNFYVASHLITHKSLWMICSLDEREFYGFLWGKCIILLQQHYFSTSHLT